MESGDPSAPQTRLAVSGSGRQVWVDLTSADRLKVINELPSRWPDVIKARESGKSLDEIALWAKCPPPCKPSCRFEDKTVTGAVDVAERVHLGPACLAYLVAECYGHIESRLSDIAQARAKLLP